MHICMSSQIQHPARGHGMLLMIMIMIHRYLFRLDLDHLSQKLICACIWETSAATIRERSCRDRYISIAGRVDTVNANNTTDTTTTYTSRSSRRSTGSISIEIDVFSAIFLSSTINTQGIAILRSLADNVGAQVLPLIDAAVDSISLTADARAPSHRPLCRTRGMRFLGPIPSLSTCHSAISHWRGSSPLGYYSK